MSIVIPVPDRYDEPELSSWVKWTRGLKNFLAASGITDDPRSIFFEIGLPPKTIMYSLDNGCI
jgi:hypothetical protein